MLYTQPQSQSSAGDLRDGAVVGRQRRGKFGKFSHSGRVTGKLFITDDLFLLAVPKTTQTRCMDGSVQATQMTTQVTPSLHHFSFLLSTQSSFQYSDNKA